MKSRIFNMVLAANIVALGILFATWWVNGRDDTWLYAVCAFIVLSSFLYVTPPKKGGDR